MDGTGGNTKYTIKVCQILVCTSWKRQRCRHYQPRPMVRKEAAGACKLARTLLCLLMQSTTAVGVGQCLPALADYRLDAWLCTQPRLPSYQLEHGDSTLTGRLYIAVHRRVIDSTTAVQLKAPGRRFKLGGRAGMNPIHTQHPHRWPNP